jgi:hypothetical protein
MTDDDGDDSTPVIMLDVLLLWCLVGLVLWYVILKFCGVFDA